MRRGDVFWVDFGQPFGSEPGYRRPALVVQADTFNESGLGTVILVPLTKNREWEAAPGNVLLRPKETSLTLPSVANVSQMTVADRRYCWTQLVARLCCRRLPWPPEPTPSSPTVSRRRFKNRTPAAP